jgi:hypothetical protein
VNAAFPSADKVVRLVHIVLVLFASAFVVQPCFSKPIKPVNEINYPKEYDRSCPIFYSPAPWFKWKQRYVYEIKKGDMAQKATKGSSFMNGYGGFYDDVISDSKTTYHKYVWLDSISPEEIETTTLVRIQDYDSPLKNEKGMTWYSKGMNKLIFDDEIIIFDYPLVLGKTWHSETTMKKNTSVSFTGEVVAYVPSNIKSEKDIIVAPGKEYKLPFSVSDIPRPMKEIGDLYWASLVQKAASSPESERTIAWSSVKVPSGPHKGENVTGYYVIQTRTKIAGITVMEQELWKDVRGYVPMYDTYKYPPLALPQKHRTKVAKIWTGTSELKE